MKMKKLLSMLLSLCIVLTTIGTLSIAVNAEDTITKTVNVPQNVTYTLPATVNEQAVTWSPATVDTSKIGYKLYTGTLEDNSTVTYRVNVGEWKVFMSDDLEHLKTVNDAQDYWGNIKVNGASFYKRAYGYDNNGCTATSVNDSGNWVLSCGPAASSPGYTMWMWEASNKIYDEFKMSYKLKITDYDLSVANNDGSHSIHKSMFGASSNAIETRIHEKNNSTEFDGISVYINNAPDTNIPKIPTTEYTYTVTDNKLNTGWIEFNLLAFDKTFTFTSGNAEVMSQRTWGKNNPTTHGVNRIDQGKATDQTAAPGKVYFDDISVSKLIYVTDTLENKSATATVAQNAASAQTTTVALAMSDGSTKNFTVNYTADTATAGKGKTAQGTIDGFDGTIPVTYTVTGVVNETINTYIGADVTLADGSKADTSAFGRKYYTVATEDIITNYTVNVGEFTNKLKDTMSGHTADTTDSSYETITPGNVDGMSLNLKKGTGTEANSIKLREIDGNKVLMLDHKTSSDHATWRIADGFSGTYKVKMRLKADKSTQNSNQYGLRFSIHNTTGAEIFRCLLDVNGTNYSLGAYRNDQQSTTYATTALTTDGTNYTTGWFDVEVIGKDTGTFDIYVNGERVGTDHQLMTVFDTTNKADTLVPVSTNRNIGSVVVTQRYDNGVTSYIDDLEIFNYRYFAGNPSDEIEVLVGQGEADNATLYLPTSNGSVKAFENVTLSGIDTDVIGNNELEISIPGFDDEFNINAKVCNYQIKAIGYKVGDKFSEFATAPQNGGTVSTAQIENKGSLSAATALFAWYNSSHKLESVKKVNISGIGKNESKTVEVGLELPDNVEGGYLKVFVLDSMNKLIPVDVAEVFENDGLTKPVVYTVGDSTMCNYPIQKNGQWPRTGVGMVLGDYFDGITVNNDYASSGEWTESFIDEGWWTGIKNNLKEGDYVIISLGHNDQGKCTEKYSPQECVYKKNLKIMLDDAKAACANVIFYSPIRRQHEADADTYPDPFDRTGKDILPHSHYADMEELASEEGVPYIDMTAISAQMLEGKTQEEQQKYYVRDLYNSVVTRKETNYTSHANWAENSYFRASVNETDSQKNPAMADTSHYNVFGAKTYARRIADEIKALNIILSGYVNDTAVTAYPGF